MFEDFTTEVIYCPKCGEDVDMNVDIDDADNAICPQCNSRFIYLGWELAEDGDERN